MPRCNAPAVRDIEGARMSVSLMKQSGAKKTQSRSTPPVPSSSGPAESPCAMTDPDRANVRFLPFGSPSSRWILLTCCAFRAGSRCEAGCRCRGTRNAPASRRRARSVRRCSYASMPWPGICWCLGSYGSSSTNRKSPRTICSLLSLLREGPMPRESRRVLGDSSERWAARPSSSPSKASRGIVEFSFCCTVDPCSLAARRRTMAGRSLLE